MANHEITRLTPEEIKNRVEKKLLDAEENPQHYHTIWLSNSLIGFSAFDFDFNQINDAIIVLKQGSNVLYIKIEDGKVVNEPKLENMYLAFKSDKSVNCRACIDGHTQYFHIKQHDDFAVEDKATIYIVLKHDKTHLFTLFFTPEEGELMYRNDMWPQYMLETLYKAHRKFFALPSNFRNAPKTPSEESEDEE